MRWRGIVVLMGVGATLGALPAFAAAAQFADTVVSIPVGGTPNSVADGDFNSDNDPDIVAGRYSAGSVAVSLGEPGFDFAAPEIYPAGGNPDALGSADLTGDGDLELLVGNRNSDDVSVLIGGAGGSFTPGPGPFAGGNGPEDLVVADFDGDGNPDVAVADFFAVTGDVTLLQGTGGGNFVPGGAVSTGDWAANGVAAGDFNGDGDRDLAVSSGFVPKPDSGRVAIFLGGSGMSFGGPEVHPFPEIPRDIVLADIDGDGRDDIVAPASGVLYTLTGNADGTFTDGPQAAIDSLAIGIASADFNGDRDPDVVFATGGETVGVSMGGEGATFGRPQYLGAGFENFAVVTGEYSDDNHPEFAVANQADGTVFVYRNTGETAQPPPARANCLGKAATIVGTDGDDVLRGTGKADVIAGLGGRDTLKGRGGKDRLCGGGGKDKLVGGPGRDKCAGGPAKDTERGCP